MSQAPWRIPLSRALQRNRSEPYSRYFQLATLTSEGKPANRTVVFRGFYGNTNQIKVITDARSEKISHIQHSAWGEVCWYFPQTREQFRLSVRLTLVDVDTPDETLQKERLESWQNLSDTARQQFIWSSPGQPRQDNDPAFSSPLPDSQQPLPHFCLLLLNPQRVDHLELRGEPQNRCLYSLNESNLWDTLFVNP